MRCCSCCRGRRAIFSEGCATSTAGAGAEELVGGSRRGSSRVGSRDGCAAGRECGQGESGVCGLCRGVQTCWGCVGFDAERGSPLRCGSERKGQPVRSAGGAVTGGCGRGGAPDAAGRAVGDGGRAIGPAATPIVLVCGGQPTGCGHPSGGPAPRRDGAGRVSLVPGVRLRVRQARTRASRVLPRGPMGAGGKEASGRSSVEEAI